VSFWCCCKQGGVSPPPITLRDLRWGELRRGTGEASLTNWTGAVEPVPETVAGLAFTYIDVADSGGSDFLQTGTTINLGSGYSNFDSLSVRVYGFSGTNDQNSGPLFDSKQTFRFHAFKDLQTEVGFDLIDGTNADLFFPGVTVDWDQSAVTWQTNNGVGAGYPYYSTPDLAAVANQVLALPGYDKSIHRVPLFMEVIAPTEEMSQPYIARHIQMYFTNDNAFDFSGTL